jgi:hypothetical protein
MYKLKTISTVFALVCLFVLGVNFAAEARSHTNFGFSFGVGQRAAYPAAQVAYYQPAPIYYQPAPTYYQTVPTYYQPVYARPAPVVVYQQAPCAVYPVRPPVENRASFEWSVNRYR